MENHIRGVKMGETREANNSEDFQRPQGGGGLEEDVDDHVGVNNPQDKKKTMVVF